MAITLAAAACGQPLSLDARIAEGLENGGLHLETASILDLPPVVAEAAIRAAEDAFAAGGVDTEITRTTLARLAGPGNVRLGWETRDHPLVYAVEWGGATTAGLTLVSAMTGEVLYVTAYGSG